MILNENDCRRIKKMKGTVFEIMQKTKTSIFLHHRYGDSDYLPNSNDKIVTITGLPGDISKGVEYICGILEAHFNRVDLRPYDVENCGLSGFFGGEVQQKSAGGRAEIGSNWPTRNSSTIGLHPIQQKMNQTGQPFLQEVLIQKNDAMQSYKVLVNLDQMFLIMGNKGDRIMEMQDLTDCKIDIEENRERNKCMLEINVQPFKTNNNNFGRFTGGGIDFSKSQEQDANSQTEEWETLCLRAIWLMNVTINAFCDREATFCPVGEYTSLREIMDSQKYGLPPN